MTDELKDVQRIGPSVPAPVRYEKCFVCGGDGWLERWVNHDGIGQLMECRYCNGRGQIATEGGEA